MRLFCILIDDNSTDRSAVLASRAFATHEVDNVIIISSVRRGKCAGMNEALLASLDRMADFIVSIDGDVRLAKGCLVSLISALETADPGTVVTGIGVPDTTNFRFPLQEF